MAPGGTVDRAALARRAFADARHGAWLEATVWPMVGERVGEVAGGGPGAPIPLHARL